MMTQDPKNKPVIVGDNFDVPPTGVVSVQPVPELIIGPEHALLRPMAESAVLPEFSRAYEADMPTDESTALDDLLGQYPALQLVWYRAHHWFSDALFLPNGLTVLEWCLIEAAKILPVIDNHEQGREHPVEAYLAQLFDCFFYFDCLRVREHSTGMMWRPNGPSSLTNFLLGYPRSQFELNLAPSRGHPVQVRREHWQRFVRPSDLLQMDSRDASRDFSSGRMVLSLEDLEEEGY